MQKYTKKYLDYFGIGYYEPTGEIEYMPCLINHRGCQNQAVDICHIIPKSQGGKDEIENMIQGCRFCHNETEGKPQYFKELKRKQEIHITNNFN